MHGVRRDARAGDGARRGELPVPGHHVIAPPTTRAVLLRRHMDMSMRNGRMSLVSFGILALAFEAPLLPRVCA